MNIIRPTYKQLLIILILGIYLVSSAEIFNRVVAIVNEDVITLHELNSKMEEMTGRTAETMKSQDEEQYLETRRKVLEFLIDEKIAQEKIQDLGINITSDQVDAAIEGIKRNNQFTHEGLLSALKEQGLSYQKYRENVKKDMERSRLINYEIKSKIVIRDEEIFEYYQENKDRFARKGKVHLATIFLKGRNPTNRTETQELISRGEYILSRLENGETFADLAKKYSQGPGAADGGDMGQFKISQLDPELRKIVEHLSIGDVSDLIPRGGGVQIIKLLGRELEQTKSFDEVRDAIFDILYKEEINKRYGSWIKELRENSYTKIIF